MMQTKIIWKCFILLITQTHAKLCKNPKSAYTDIKRNVNFECSNEILSDGIKCLVKCPGDWKPSISEIACSCKRPSGVERRSCRWEPKASVFTPQCISPVITEEILSRQTRLYDSSKILLPQSVPYNEDFETRVYSKNQKKSARMTGEKVPSKYVIDSPKEKKHKMEKADLIQRSNQKAVPKWTDIFNRETNLFEIPYRFADSFPYSEVVTDEITGHLDWMNFELSQCLVFKETNVEIFDNARLNIIAAGQGCWSYIGNLYSEQYISLGSGCHGQGRALHEFIHALGFMHEHQRPDRDNYVDIHWENIEKNHVVDFEKTSRNKYEENYINYDVNSIMHYGSKAFSKNNNLETITFKEEYKNVMNGQRLRPTSKDIMGICRAYGCDRDCGHQTETCKDGNGIYFAHRECDGFADCQDGSDEVDCGRECCYSFNFQADRYQKVGRFNDQDYYKSTEGTFLYFHSAMGFWMKSDIVGSDHAYAFANFQAGVCVNDIAAWQMYDFDYADWVTFHHISNCEESAPPKTTKNPKVHETNQADQTFFHISTTQASKITTDPVQTDKFCPHKNLPELGHGGEYLCEVNGNKSKEGNLCSPNCMDGFKAVCRVPRESTSALCDGKNWVFSLSREEYDCKCFPIGCNYNELSIVPGYSAGSYWSCPAVNSDLVPPNSLCVPQCNDPKKTAISIHANLKCANDLNWYAGNESTYTGPDKFSKIECKSCPPPRFLLHAQTYKCIDHNGVSQTGNSVTEGSICNGLCPTGKVMSCKGPQINKLAVSDHGEQECKRVPNKNKNLSDVLQWTPVQKCKCVTACDIQHYISYAEKLSFRGKFKNVMGQGTKASIRNCPIGEKRTRKSLLCKNGNWVNSKNVSEINPKICVGRN